MNLSKCIVCTAVILIIVLAQCSESTFAQQQCKRIMVQDTTLNNLVDPPGYIPAQLGTLGNVKKSGNGAANLILIPGMGFGGDIFDEFITAHAEDYTMYAVTLPGFGGTSAPPSPPAGTSYGDLTWTNAALSAVEKLIESENIENPIILGHWLTGTQIALGVALKHPDKIRAVILAAGSPCIVMTDTSWMPPHPPLENRVTYTNRMLAPQWFKTVTRETWDDNNFLPGDYAANPILGLRLWRQAASPDLHVWIRYLCEFYAQDISLNLGDLKTPTLLIKPGLEGNYFDPGNDYMTAFCHTGWDVALSKFGIIKAATIPNSRACVWLDQPEAFDKAVDEFLSQLP